MPSIEHPKALVTGGAGFIGSHLVDRLLTDGNDVVVIDNFSRGSRDNLRAAVAHPRLTVHEMDVLDLPSHIGMMGKIESFFHLAGRADIVSSIANPQPYFRDNLDGTIATLEAARSAGVKRFIYAASISCYGIPDRYPTPETAPLRPQYPYALSKYLGEECVLHWWQVYGLPVISLRLPNVYGPRVRSLCAYGAVVGVFLAQKLAGQPLTIVGDGTQTRDFTFISDVVDSFIAAARSPLSGKVFNVGSGMPHSVNYLAQLVGGPVVHIPKRPGEPPQTFADITRISRVLGWRPKVSFAEGVGIMLQEIESWHGALVWTPSSIARATEDWFRYLQPRSAMETA